MYVILHDDMPISRGHPMLGRRVRLTLDVVPHMAQRSLDDSGLDNRG